MTAAQMTSNDDDATYNAELSNLLSLTTSSDNQIIKNASIKLQAHLKSSPLAIIALLSQAAINPLPHIRQLAAIECAKRVLKGWTGVSQNDKLAVKQNVLDIILREQVTLTRLSLSRVISQIAKIEIPLGQWRELIPWLFNSCKSKVVAHREIGASVIYTLFETLIDLEDSIDQMVKNMFRLFNITISDPDSFQVRLYTLRSLGKVAECLDIDNPDDIRDFQNLVPKMVAVLQQALNEADEDAAAKGFEEAPVLNKHLGELIQFILSVAANLQVSSSLRVMALNFLLFCCDVKRTRIQKLNLVPEMIKFMFQIGAENEDDVENDANDDDDCPSKVAFQVLNCIGINVPAQQVYPVVMEYVVNLMQSPDFGARKSCMLVLAVLVDGCGEHMRLRLDSILPIVSAGLQDQHPIVRKSACIALSSLAEEVCANHATLLPLLFQLMNDTSTTAILSHATNALDAIVESMDGKDLLQYLPSLMDKLMFLLNAPSKELRATVIGAIGSTAHAAEEKFIPYFQTTMANLLPFISTTLDEDILLRGIATDSIGAIAEAVGKDIFRPFVVDLMGIVNAGLNFKNSRLVECSFCFFAVIARVFGDEFAPYLPHVVPAILASCAQDEQTGHFDDEDDDIDLEGDVDNKDDKVHASSSIAEEKEVAADALGQIFAATTSNYMPYMQDSVRVLVELIDHYFEAVRKSAACALFQFLHTIYKMSKPTEWVAGLPIQIPVHENVAGMVDMVMSSILAMLEDEFDKNTTVSALSSIAEALKLVGPALIANPAHKDALFKLTMSIFKGEHLSQQDTGDADDDINNNENSSSSLDVDADQSEQDALLISSAADVVCCISVILGPQFSDDYAYYHPYIIKYYKPSRSANERSMAIGTVAEVSLGLKQGVTPYVEEFLRVLSSALVDEYDEVKSNAAYGIGTLYLNADIQQHMMQILGALKPLIESKGKKSVNVSDNACGAVCRIIQKSKDIIPLEHVLPILYGALPLEKDYLEYEPIVEAFVQIVSANQHQVNMTWLCQFFASQFLRFEPKSMTRVQGLLIHMRDSDPAAFHALAVSCGEEHAATLRKIVQ